MTNKKEQNKQVGDWGEQIAVNYLKNKGFSIIERNYWRKWGELDIVAKSGEVVHFVEVKTVSHETKQQLREAVTRGTWRPEEQVHQFKLHQIHKALETWIADHNYDGDWQIDVIAVRIVPRETYATVKFIENIVG
jgi:putative endonuclease